MTNPDKTFWRHMHQKTPYEFNTGNGQLFPFSFVSVIFYKGGDGFIIHADNAVIADGNPMGILSKTIKRLFEKDGVTVRKIPFVLKDLKKPPLIFVRDLRRRFVKGILDIIEINRNISLVRFHCMVGKTTKRNHFLIAF